VDDLAGLVDGLVGGHQHARLFDHLDGGLGLLVGLAVAVAVEAA